MTPAKPSPGPWYAEELGRAQGTPDPLCIRIFAADGTRVADVLPHASVGGVGGAISRENVALILAASRTIKGD